MALDAMDATQAACPHPPASFGYLGSMGDGCKDCGAIGVAADLLSFCADLCEHGSETPCAAVAPVICGAALCDDYDTDQHDDPGFCPRHTMPLYDEDERK